MSGKLAVLIIIFFIVVAGAIIGLYYYGFFISQPAGQNNQPADNNNNANLPPAPDPAKELEKIKNDYPEEIQGTITFFDKGNVFKTTLTTDDGKVYTLMPAQPKSVYESFGAKNGGEIKLRAKLLEDNKINWALMEPIQ